MTGSIVMPAWVLWVTVPVIVFLLGSIAGLVGWFARSWMGRIEQAIDRLGCSIEKLGKEIAESYVTVSDCEKWRALSELHHYRQERRHESP